MPCNRVFRSVNAAPSQTDQLLPRLQLARHAVRSRPVVLETRIHSKASDIAAATASASATETVQPQDTPTIPAEAGQPPREIEKGNGVLEGGAFHDCNRQDSGSRVKTVAEDLL